MTLPELIADPQAPVDDLAALLDAMDAEARWAALSGLHRGQQRALYRKADPTSIDLNDLVTGAGPLAEVIHDGVNTLPVPPPLRRFQKRFCRTGDGSDRRLFGYNEGPTRRIFGPGYFVARPASPDDPASREYGGVVIDYGRIPDGSVPPGWPRIVPNAHGLQRFVYHRTRDFLRRVSAHVSIGAVVKGDRPLDHYFVLCRRA